MSSLEASFENACADGTIPGAVLMAANRDGNVEKTKTALEISISLVLSGSLKYAKAFGVRSLQTKEPMALDTTMWIASCTKLMTSIAAMQCIERGQIKLDDDVAELLPELTSAGILTGFNEDTGEPIIKKRENTITLRHLLTHSAGCSYDAMSPLIMRYRKQRGESPDNGATVIERCNAPLLYEPGTSWGYGTSMDWAGKLVERLTGQTLEGYMEKHIWSPLDITDITFWPDKHPELKARQAHMSSRAADGSGIVKHGGFTLSTDGVEDCFGGHGALASMQDYFKVLQSLLADDEKLLKKEMTKTMFEPQLSEKSKEAQKYIWSKPELSMLFVGEFPSHVGLSWGVGGLLTRDDDEGWRKKNTLTWSGMPNLLWFIDREAGLCGMYGGQVMPPGDKQVEKMISLFEKEMYGRTTSAKTKM